MDAAPNRPTAIRYYVLAALCLVTLINYMQRNSIGGVETTLRSDLQIDQTVTGRAMSFFFVSYALMQIPCGWLAQRWGPRRALTAYTVGWSLATATLALAHGPASLYGSRLAMGILQAGIFPCATLIMVAWLPASQRGFASALLNSFMLIGAAFVSNLTAFLLAPLGWRALFVVYAFPGLAWAAWFWFWFRDSPQEHRSVNAAELAEIEAGRAKQREGSGKNRSAVKAPGRAWLLVILSLPLWLICVQQFCRAGANRFTDQWLSTYLQEGPLKHLTDLSQRKALANNLASAPHYAGVVGGLIGGGLSDYVLRKTGRRRAARNGVAAVSLLLTTLSYLPLLIVENSAAHVFFFSFGSFLSAFAAPCAYAVSMDVGGRNLPVVFGAMNMFGNFGAAAITGVTPYLIQRPNGLGAAAGGALAAQPSVSLLFPPDWHWAIGLFISIHVVALVCWLLIDPNRAVGAAPAEE
jgi:sugar phosphate permease